MNHKEVKSLDSIPLPPVYSQSEARMRLREMERILAEAIPMLGMGSKKPVNASVPSYTAEGSQRILKNLSMGLKE